MQSNPNRLEKRHRTPNLNYSDPLNLAFLKFLVPFLQMYVYFQCQSLFLVRTTNLKKGKHDEMSVINEVGVIVLQSKARHSLEYGFLIISLNDQWHFLLKIVVLKVVLNYPLPFNFDSFIIVNLSKAICPLEQRSLILSRYLQAYI